MNGKTKHIVFDGSFKDGIHGVGLVMLDTDFEILDVKSIQLSTERNSKLYKHGHIQTEFIAAISAINNFPTQTSPVIYGDSTQVIEYINADRILRARTKERLEPTISFLDKLITTRQVKAIHKGYPAATAIARHAFSIAHNASADASGSFKRERTLPYTGAYSSIEDTVNPPHKHLK